MRRLLFRLILPVLTALAVVAGVNAAMVSLRLPPLLNDWGKTYDDYDVIYTEALAAQQRGKRVVAFIGDSRIEWGIDPEAVQEQLQAAGVADAEVFNLALPGRNVTSILARLNEVGFHPDLLVVGYSHLSFYWSKNHVEVAPRALGWWQSDVTRINSLVRRKVPMWGYQPEAVKTALVDGWRPPETGFGSWLEEITVTPRGQARVHYKLAEDVAIGFQRDAYEQMYSVPMSAETITATNSYFLGEVEKQRSAGAKVVLLKMPLSDWAQELENANEPASLAALAGYLGTPYLDGNAVPDADLLKTFDGLHLIPPDAAQFSAESAEVFLLPNL
jgi:hypothetical protein